MLTILRACRALTPGKRFIFLNARLKAVFFKVAYSDFTSA
jgi:hypothetical protein